MPTLLPVVMEDYLLSVAPQKITLQDQTLFTSRREYHVDYLQKPRFFMNLANSGELTKLSSKLLRVAVPSFSKSK